MISKLTRQALQIPKANELPIQPMTAFQPTQWKTRTSSIGAFRDYTQSGLIYFKSIYRYYQQFHHNTPTSTSTSSNSSSNSREVSNTGSSKCTTCNRKFKFHRWIETGAGGWENVEDTKYGWIKCSSCTGYGVTMDFDSFNQVPRSERCYMSCNNGWEKCRDSDHRNE